MHISGSSLIQIFDDFKETKIEKYFVFKSKYKTASYSSEQTKDIFLRTIASKLSLIGQNIATL